MIVSIILTFLASSTLAKVNYDGHQVHRVHVHDENVASHLYKLQQDGLFDFWTEIRVGGTVDLMSPPHLVPVLKDWLDNIGLKHSLMIHNVESLIQLEAKSNVLDSKQNKAHNMEWTNYHSLEDIYEWFDFLETEYDFVEVEVIGQTYEGRDMKVLKICKGGCGSKPAMWIDSGIHAREWISPATGTWMLNELLENDAAHPEFTEKLDWYFLPSANPDGYAKSRNEDRLWRKTTSVYPESSCIGVDANRNFDVHWGEVGASPDPCSLTYQGPEAFSEIEARNIRDYVSARTGQIKFFQTLHSYSQLILFPWGYTSSPAPGYDAMNDLAQRGNEALFEVHGKTYEAGCIPCVLYTASGTSLDWALGVAEVPYVYTIELRDTGNYGFILPANQIIPNAEEVWAFHAVAAKQIIEEFGDAM